MNYTVYDLETIKSPFTACFKNYETGEKKMFVICESRNDLIPLVKFLRGLKRYGYTLVGFNCLRFDGQILYYILEHYQELKKLSGGKIAAKIHDLANKIIALSDEEKFRQLIPEWELPIEHIDVFRQQHFDRPQKRTSLKWLEFTMRFSNIQSMPVDHNDVLVDDEILIVLDYNENDVDGTENFFRLTMFETDLRIKLSKNYNKNLLNAPEPKIAREIFGIFLSNALSIHERELKEMRTYRSNIEVGEIIFPYVKFKDPIFQGVYNYYKELQFNPYETKENNKHNDKKPELTFKWHNLHKVVTALGGVHGCVKPGIYESTANWLIEDIDAESYYPNLGIRNKLYPEHLGETFCDVYEDIFNQRKVIPKEDPINYTFKIILNSAYGLSKELNNYFHDPKYTYAITVNGQLLMLMLAQALRDKVPGIVFYQLNTDGVTVGYDAAHKPIVEKIRGHWEKLTKIKLENKFYKKMVIIDVNNYIAVDTKDKVKRKGRFGYSMNPEDKEMTYYKNPSGLIVPKALEQYYVHGVDYEKYIRECTDIFDFCHGVKVKRDFALLQYTYNHETSKIDVKNLNQAVVRYYMSNTNSTLKKLYKNTSKQANQTEELQKGWRMTYYNRHVEKPMPEYNIDYKFYIQKVRSIIEQIEPNKYQYKMEF